MERYFTKTFGRFLAGFLLVLIAAFGVMFFVNKRIEAGPRPVDNVAVPQ